jgi:hypothetical protein
MLTTQRALPRAPMSTGQVRQVRRIAAIIALLALLIAGTTVVNALNRDDAGAVSDPVNCVVGGLAGVGSGALVIAYPPAGIVEIVAQGALGAWSVFSIADACGAWWSTDLSEVIHLYVRAGTTGGGGSW